MYWMIMGPIQFWLTKSRDHNMETMNRQLVFKKRMKLIKTTVPGLTNNPAIPEKHINKAPLVIVLDKGLLMCCALETNKNVCQLTRPVYILQIGSWYILLICICPQLFCTTLTALQILYYSPEFFMWPKSSFCINSAHFHFVNYDVSSALQLKLKIASFIS